MLYTPGQYRRACEVVAELEAKVKVGTATDRDWQRYLAGLEEILCWEWAEQGKQQRLRESADTRTRRTA